MTKYLPLILLGVLLNAAAQLALKQGMHQIGQFEFRLETLCRASLAAALSPFVLVGLACYVVSVAVWLLVLSRVEVSFAYPLLSVGYVVVALVGWLVFQEAVSPVRWAGILMICLGVWLITRSG